MILEWRAVQGFEGLYEVSNQGQIRNLKRDRLLSPRFNRDGYSRAALSKNNSYTHLLTHRIVAQAFLGHPPKGKPLVLHKDGNPRNNEVSNLRWGSNSDNMFDRGEHGTDFHRNKTECVNGHSFTAENTYRNREGHRSCQICRRKHTTISNTKKRSNRKKEENNDE